MLVEVFRETLKQSFLPLCWAQARGIIIWFTAAVVTQPLSKFPGECGGTLQRWWCRKCVGGVSPQPLRRILGSVSKGFSFSISNITRIYTKLLLLFQLLLDKPVYGHCLVILFSKNCLKEGLGGPTKINAIFFWLDQEITKEMLSRFLLKNKMFFSDCILITKRIYETWNNAFSRST